MRLPCSDGEGPRARPKFLVNRNILDVIERLAHLGLDDVVLEVGGGPGVLSERLAARTGHVHVVEVDRGLERRLRDARDFDNVTVHVGDALELDLPALDPAPSKMVSNLPYGIAATIVLKTIDELPSITEWVVMVQREVGNGSPPSLGPGPMARPRYLLSSRAMCACCVRSAEPCFVPYRTSTRFSWASRATTRGRRRRCGTRSRGLRTQAQGAGRLARARPGRAGGDPGPGAGRAPRARSSRRRARRATESGRSSGASGKSFEARGVGTGKGRTCACSSEATGATGGTRS